MMEYELRNAGHEGVAAARPGRAHLVKAYVLAPLELTLRLALRLWPQLLLLALLGRLVSDSLLSLSVSVGLVNRLAGLGVLSLVVLTKLVVIVLMFQIIWAVMQPSDEGVEEVSRADGPARGGLSAMSLGTVTAHVLVPFFAYYAAWGFLGDTVREYSRIALSRFNPFDADAPKGSILDVLDSRWLLLSVALSWAVRWFAKSMRNRTKAAPWQFVIVACDTNWIFIGLYVLSRWKDQVWEWIGSGGLWQLWQWLQIWIDPFVTAAWASSFVPVEQVEPGLVATARSLFFYALLPVVWLVMAALICGYDLATTSAIGRQRHIGGLSKRYASLPLTARRFIDHFVSGYRSRYLPVIETVWRTLTASPLLLITLIVGYRALDWTAAWTWLAMSRLVGPHEIGLWQVIADLLSVFIGGPAEPGRGVIFEVVRICFLAAIVKCALSTSERRA
ncbi:hypothetical protein [Bradyrhizobium sp. LHD-71]|uniref:hypothetical protein n=1 Tax=Bradyrhizobium sp. LHD-71 TaxID=3072141 RepID=UPI00280E3E36|nr:hypothetical protein [Bradyrhizobium sp. LHD-71]MDQ8730258.1 hypothetical protein [Bradyrhizobium sp. LHD-71]